jgi:hypothetical protein
MVVFKNHPGQVSPPHSSDPPPPPKKKPLTTSGGSGIPPIPKKKPLFSFFFTIFACSVCLLSEAVSGKMKMNFQNPRDFFSHNGMKKKNLSQFFHRCHEQGESKPSSRPFFPDFHFSVTVLILRELLRPDGGEFGETEGGFCP